MEQFVNSVSALSSQGNYSQLCEIIRQSSDVLTKNAANLDNLLGMFDPQLHSLGVLAVLCVKFQLPSSLQPDFETLFSQIQLFFTTCNGEQVRHATDSYAALSHYLTRSLIEKNQPLRGINIIQQAISKIQMHSAELTSLHADLCQLCLLSKCFKPALPFLEVDITDINKEGGQFDAFHFLCYCYYGGMIYTALKLWDKALYFFEVALTTPAMAVSHVMLESYKKYVLVSLILHGKLLNIPKYTSQVVTRFVKPLSQSYHEFAQVYITNNAEELQTMITKHEEQFARDQNMGLIKQSIASLYKKNIQKLTKTFLTLSLTDIARRVQLPNPKKAELHVLHMIEDHMIYATISKRDGMVCFNDNPEKFNNPNMLRLLDNQIRCSISLEEKLRQMEQDISVNPQYVQKSMGLHSQEDDLTTSSKLSGFNV